MGPRRKSREFALEILYQMDLQRQDLSLLLTVLNEYWALRKKSYSEQLFKDVQNFTAILVKGVLQYRDSLDDKIVKYLDNWDLEQISVIDKNIMRMALFEILYVDDVPSQVTLNEAVEVAKKYGSQESHHFVNGVLDRIYKRALQTR